MLNTSKDPLVESSELDESEARAINLKGRENVEISDLTRNPGYHAPLSSGPRLLTVIALTEPTVMLKPEVTTRALLNRSAYIYIECLSCFIPSFVL